MEWKSERPPRFAAFSSTSCEHFFLLLPLPYPPASTSPGNDLPRGLLKGSCGRRKRKSIRDRLNIGTLMPASDRETLIQAGVGKNFDGIYDSRQQQYDMCCISYSLFICRTFVQKVQCRQFATHIDSICVPGLLVEAIISSIQHIIVRIVAEHRQSTHA